MRLAEENTYNVTYRDGNNGDGETYVIIAKDVNDIYRKMGKILGCTIRHLNGKLTWVKRENRRKSTYIMFDLIKMKEEFRGSAEEVAEYAGIEPSVVYVYANNFSNGTDDKQYMVARTKYAVYNSSRCKDVEEKLKELRPVAIKKFRKKKKAKIKRMKFDDFEKEIYSAGFESVADLGKYLRREYGLSPVLTNETESVDSYNIVDFYTRKTVLTMEHEKNGTEHINIVISKLPTDKKRCKTTNHLLDYYFKDATGKSICDHIDKETKKMMSSLEDKDSK